MWTWIWATLAWGAPQADAVISAAVRAHGLESADPLEIAFTFRGTPYRLALHGRTSRYERTVTADGGGVRVDELVGGAFRSLVSGTTVSLTPEEQGARRRSLNSVAYFALLPRPLQDDAVISRWRGTTMLRGTEYDTVDVTFRAEGGGDDHDDQFRYWFDPTTHRIAYLAYSFSRGEGGVRLRAATRAHEQGGVVLLDWDNYGRDGQSLTIDEAVAAFESDTLPKVSSIVLEDVRVERAGRHPH